VPADADALAFFPFRDTRAGLIDHAGDLVSWNTWVRYTGKEAFFCYHVTVADATGKYTDPHVSRTGFRNFTLHDFEIPSRTRHLY